MSINRPIVVLFSLVILVLLVGCGKATDPGPEPLPDNTDSESDWSPDGSRIVFQRSFSYIHNTVPGIYFYNFSDSSITLFQKGDGFSSLRFSPDGQWLAFSYAQNIYKAKVNGDSLTQLTFSERNYCPDWSPDGKKIAYEYRGGDDRGIYLLDVETLETKLIYRFASFTGWIPSSDKIVTLSFAFHAFPEVTIVDTLGTFEYRITENSAIKKNPAVSWDGEYICFLQKFPEKYSQLWIVQKSGEGLKQLTNNGGDFPSFSPDGKWIVYTHTGQNDGTLWIMHPDGSQKRQLTSFEDKSIY